MLTKGPLTQVQENATNSGNLDITSTILGKSALSSCIVIATAIIVAKMTKGVGALSDQLVRAEKALLQVAPCVSVYQQIFCLL